MLSAVSLLLVGCANYDSDINRIDEELDRIENTRIKSLSEQIDRINVSLPELEQTDKDLKDMIKSLEGTAGDLQKAIAENGAKIEAVNADLAKALDERAQKIADGLAAADKAKSELAAADQRVKKELAAASNETATRLADAERRAQAIIEEAKARATDEGNKIVAAARAEAEQQAIAAREALREQVAVLAVKGAEQILRKEINAGVHADLLNRLKTEL